MTQGVDSHMQWVTAKRQQELWAGPANYLTL
jgi:hypothetical protein